MKRLPLPDEPQNLTATAISPTSIKLTWDAVSVDGGIKDYRIYSGLTPVLIGKTTDTSFVVKGLTPDTIHYFDVSAVSNYGGIESTHATTDAMTPAA